MAKAVFTTSESSAYDDQPEERYHFPRTYLRQAQAAVGDWILYYEPRRTTGQNSATGRQAYFAMAWLASIEPDPVLPDHHYAYLRHFIEFDRPVPFREGDRYYESALVKEDGSTNKGSFGRAVRGIPDEEFELITRAGFTRPVEAWESLDRVAEPVAEYQVHPIVEQIVSRKFRDAAFRRHVRQAYENRCAVTGLRLINGGGRPEVQAAHIRPVEKDGPDTVRNGLALTGTVHWLFDRGLITVSDDHKLLVSPQGLPEDLGKLVHDGKRLILPGESKLMPHPTYLEWHRNHVFKR